MASIVPLSIATSKESAWKERFRTSISCPDNKFNIAMLHEVVETYTPSLVELGRVVSAFVQWGLQNTKDRNHLMGKKGPDKRETDIDINDITISIVPHLKAHCKILVPSVLIDWDVPLPITWNFHIQAWGFARTYLGWVRGEVQLNLRKIWTSQKTHYVLLVRIVVFFNRRNDDGKK
jgi:hypothetical protein